MRIESIHGQPDIDLRIAAFTPPTKSPKSAMPTLKLKNGREARVTMHVLEGSREEIEKQLKISLDSFFDFYPEI